MNLSEFSAGFDVLYNNVTSNQAAGLNEYEKSVFLTKAEYQLVTEYFNSRMDGAGGGFDGSQKRQYDFSGLLRVENLFNVNTFKNRITDAEKLDRRSLVYLFPMNYFLSVNELLYDSRYQYSVSPLDYAEYQRLMLKPYNFPVKRCAWRLITDKKNCNYCHESAVELYDDNQQFIGYETLEDDDSTIQAKADYKILTAWADQKRNLEFTIMASNSVGGVSASSVGAVVGDYDEDWEEITGYAWSDDEENFSLDFIFDGKWSSDKNTYKLCVCVQPAVANSHFKDDEQALEACKAFFKDLKDGKLFANADPNTGAYVLAPNGEEAIKITQDREWAKAATHLDGLALCTAPSKFATFFRSGGRKFITHVVQIPMIEIIGKFAKNEIPKYQMRFVRKLSPIILTDLENYGDDLSINGITRATECTLPEEMHEEILERAVTLAKIAWQGGTATQAQAAAAQNSRR